MKSDAEKNQVHKSGFEIQLPITGIEEEEEEINMIFKEQLEDSLDFLSKPARLSKQPRRKKSDKSHSEILYLNTRQLKKDSIE